MPIEIRLDFYGKMTLYDETTIANNISHDIEELLKRDNIRFDIIIVIDKEGE